ncbi:MAG: methionyl-tRNA formyltransferase [Acidobacteriota bacterium]|nr:methionyl-tRNA formyltransferase [Acidobacteriota bacterium]
MELAFLGTPEAAVPTLDALVDAGHDVNLVITREDKRRARGGDLSPSPVKRRALELGLRVSHDLDDVLDGSSALGVVVAYGRLVPAATLARVPMLNVHFSLLPRWRGAAPVEHAILAGDVETGVNVMTMEEGLDTGPVHLERRVRVGELDAAALRHELSLLGAGAIVEVLASPQLLTSPRPQEGEATYAKKITRADRLLDPRESAEVFRRRCRIGGAELHLDDRRLFVERSALADVVLDSGVARFVDGALDVGCATGAVRLLDVRPEGGRSMKASDWWRGRLRERTTATWSPSPR